jgi:cytochrome c5
LDRLYFKIIFGSLFSATFKTFRKILERFVHYALALAVALVLLLLCIPALAEQPLPTGEGQRIYQQTCVVCHGDGVGGAPKPGVALDWEYRLSFGIEEVYLNAIEGLGPPMPPRGLCADCSDAQVRAVVDFMIEDLQ